MDGGREWIELFNGGEDSCNLANLSLEYGTSAFSKAAELDPGVLLPKGFAVIGGPQAEVTLDQEIEDLALGNASANADALRLVLLGSDVIDTVVYGDVNEDGWIDDSGAEASSLAPHPPQGESVGRCPDGVDTDLSAADFVVYATPTPGSSNDPSAPCTEVGAFDDTGPSELDSGSANDSGAGEAGVETDPVGCSCNGGDKAAAGLGLLLALGGLRRRRGWRRSGARG